MSTNQSSGLFQPIRDEYLPVRSLDDPPVVDIFECVAGDLLLVRGSSTIRVSDRIHVFMRVEPAGLAVGVSQRDLTPVNNDLGLTSDNGSQTTIQARL